MLNQKILFFLVLFQLILCSVSNKIDDNIHEGFVIDSSKNQFSKAPEYVITASRLQDLRKDLLYWYSDEKDGDYQDDIHGSSPTIHKDLNFHLPFFGFRFNYTRVSLNGYLEFSDPPEQHREYPLIFPNEKWPQENDHSFIGIFYSKCRIGNLRDDEYQQKRPGVYFRVERDLLNRTDEFGVELRERLMWDVREGIIGAETFKPKHAVIATWKNISFAGGIENALYITNTFQMVLATDEIHTYVIYNYLDLKWTTHTEAGGDTTTGEGGVPAFIGFNAGNGTRSYEYKAYSQESFIKDLTKEGFVNNFPGRHIFRIDENIMKGSCIRNIDGNNLPLEISPTSGNMLGGTIVNITGPCFKPNDKIRCKFDVVAEEVVGIYVNTNRAICIQPQLQAEGYLTLRVSVNDDKYKWTRKYFVETPASADEKIYFENPGIHETKPQSIKISWKYQNLTNYGAVVKMSLWGYRERTIRPDFVYIDILEEAVPNIGDFEIIPEKYHYRDNILFKDIKFGFLQLNSTIMIETGEGKTIEAVAVIWSRPIPLGWYFSPQWEREYGEKWAKDLCSAWIKNDRYLQNFIHGLPECPCNLQEALNDKGLFSPDLNCDKDSNPLCQFNRGAVHCVTSGVPNTQRIGEQQCCYDIRGSLMLTSDNKRGSSPFRSHRLGNLPWNEAMRVPTLSQWYHDMVPKYLCCLWQEESEGCEILRFERRPSQNCTGYQPPTVAGIFGNLHQNYTHIITFDGLKYEFDGLGDFSLVQVQNGSLKLDVQCRFERNEKDGETKKSKLTSIIARGKSSTLVEVRLRNKYSNWRYKTDVLVDKKRVYFDRPSLKFQHFPGVLVYTPTYILNQSEVIIMFESGAGVEVIESNGFLTSKTYLPKEYNINQTRGLFGIWNTEVSDDYTAPQKNWSEVDVEQYS